MCHMLGSNDEVVSVTSPDRLRSTCIHQQVSGFKQTLTGV